MSKALHHSRFHFHPEQLETPVWVFDLEHARVLWANPAAVRLWSADSLEVLTAREFEADKLRDDGMLSVHQSQANEAESSAKWFTRQWVFYPDGEPLNVLCYCKPVLLDDGRSGMLVEALSRRDEAERQVENQSSAQDNAGLMISVFDELGHLLSRNHAAELVRSGHDLLADYFSDPEQGDLIRQRLLSNRSGVVTMDLQVSGRGRWHRIELRLGYDPFRGDQVLLLTEQDITRQKSHQVQLEHAVHYDALTGLPNRTLLTNQLELALQSRQKDKQLALVYLDLDGFKEVNDTYGNDLGDQLLIEVGQRLKKALRSGDTLARLGGDEFVVVLSNVGNAGEYKIVLDRLIHAITMPIQLRNTQLHVSASLGVTLYPDDDSDADTLLRHADQAMCQAKALGKNRYHVFDPFEGRNTTSQQENILRIEQAIDNEEMELYYQPKVNMRTGQIIGAEALIRWNHPQQGVLSPAAFLPIIEDTSSIFKLDTWVLRAALKQQTLWQQAGLRLCLSVNIAALDLQQPDFLQRLQGLLAEYPLVDTDLLELEVLETAALEDIVKVSGVMKEIAQLGIHFSLDDFGTGYSSLSYLRRLPAGALKIDQTFVRDMLWDVEDTTLVQGVISLATAFQRSVVAEGVETEEHGELLLRLGCEIGQGYGISRPIQADAFSEWVSQWTSFQSWKACQNFPVNRDNLALIYAEVDHRGWLRGIENYLNDLSATPPPLYSSEASSVWYKQGYFRRMRQQPEFAAIEPLYQQIDKLSAQIYQLKGDGQEQRAKQAFAQLELISRELVDQLRTLYIVMNCQW
ncbi:putative bifunctional diguanylate cyclase/phosphodiesterase [Nitrincola sp. MINF-07-Sa-05]|uniref:putative bifunctional diguanylate cyclase/phosphodiesterase n=1 Tax=Nitrincola salilacus TaxID=3400273 RepID=UPI0039181EC7